MVVGVYVCMKFEHENLFWGFYGTILRFKWVVVYLGWLSYPCFDYNYLMRKFMLEYRA